LLDRSQKKITFLRRVVAQLDLRECQPEAASAEELARRLAPEARFDAVVTRGVGRVSHLLSLTAPLLRPGGALLLRKPVDTAELREAEGLLASETWEDVRRLVLPAMPRPAWILLICVKA
jgi:16S rRNA (guanine527-N7)-methyltransferase